MWNFVMARAIREKKSIAPTPPRIYELFKPLDRCKALALHVFRHHTRLQELQQIVRAARLGANPRELEPAERLPRHDRPRNVPVDI